MAKILITGGTGLIGKILSEKLSDKGYEIAILSRTKNIKNKEKFKYYHWDVDRKIIDPKSLEDVDYIIHLAGSNIAEKRWTDKRKKQLIDSRTNSSQLIFDSLKKQEHKPKAFISSSAIGYYGAVTSNKIYTEEYSSYNDFLGKVCRVWEEFTSKFEDLGIRTVKIRTGIVLTEKGGALSKIIKPVKLGFGSAIGSGEQYMPWIHIDDLCNIYLKAIEDVEMRGAYNAVSPEHINNKDFTLRLSRILNKPIWLPNIPAFVMKLAFGEMADILLEGSRVSSDKIVKSGFRFKYTNLEEALKKLLAK